MTESRSVSEELTRVGRAISSLGRIQGRPARRLRSSISSWAVAPSSPPSPFPRAESSGTYWNRDIKGSCITPSIIYTCLCTGPNRCTSTDSGQGAPVFPSYARIPDVTCKGWLPVSGILRKIRLNYATIKFLRYQVESQLHFEIP